MANRRFLTRRGFFRAGLAAALAGAGAYCWARWIEPFWVEFTERPLPIAGLPAALAGQTLVQLSDLHIGPDVEDSYLRAAFQQVEQRAPDWVVVTGDFMTCRDGEQLDHAARVLDDLPRGRLGTLAILGNHDYTRTWRNRLVADQLTDTLERRGVRVLRNQKVTIAGLTFVGLDELWSPWFSTSDQFFASLPPEQPALVLSHNPDSADRPIWANYRGWILCGHTHGGQCKPPWMNPPFLPVSNRRYIAGEVDLGDGRRLYINRGLGHLRHVRFNARPEITLFTLRPGESAA